MGNIEQLLRKFEQGTISEDEVALLKSHAQTDDLNHAITYLKGFIEATASYKVPENINTNLAWEKFSNNQEFSEHLNQRKRSWLPLGVLSFLVILGLALWGIYNKVPDTSIAASSHIEKITLVDDSYLTLDTNSTITYSKGFNVQNRTVSMTGKVHFDIKHSTEYPFTVELGGSKLVVIGTDFIVDTKNPNTRVVKVRSGKIAFYANEKSKPAYVIQGQTLLFDKKYNSISITDTMGLSSFYWVDQNLVFKSALLIDVLRTLEDVFKVNYIVNSPKITNCHLTAEFKKSDLVEIHTTLEQILGIKISKIDKNSYGVFGGNCQ